MKAFPVLLGVALLGIPPITRDGTACEICGCIREPSPTRARDASAAVFSGRVVALLARSVALPDSTRQRSQRRDLVSWPKTIDVVYLPQTIKRLEVTIEVLEVWKGDIAVRTEVHTANECCVCGFPFELGKEYLIYAHRASGGPLDVSLCSRTRELSKAAEDVAALGLGAAPRNTDTSLHPPHN